MILVSKQQQEKIEELLNKMTLEDKIGQMNQEAPSIVGGFDVSFEELISMVSDGRISQDEFKGILSNAEQDYHEEDIRMGKVGSMMLQNPEKANELQRIAVEESRLGIPLIIGYDVIHGLRSVYPIAIAEAGVFDEKLFEKTANMAAKEARAYGINWTFAPMIDVARDARWGRVSEGPGEDSFLSSVFARAKVKGLQGDTSSRENYVAACLKHYVAYGACESGRDYNTTNMSLSMLHNVYLKPFKEAVKEGAATVMAAFNDLNGIPCTVNSYLLRDILTEEYGFQGFVVSDANGIKECVNHGIAEDTYDAGVKAANAGLHMDMGTHIYKEYLAEAVSKGEISIDIINDAVRRILTVKMWLGLFEQPYVTEERIRLNEKIEPEHVDLALEAAKKSIVLLKNDDNILPLNKNNKISLVGELASMRNEVAGAWAMSYQSEDCVSILDGFKNSEVSFSYYPCGGPEGDLNDDEIQAACKDGDVIVAVVGEFVNMTGEASSKANIELPGRQRELLQRLIRSGKPVVVILMNGRPIALEWENEHLSTIVEAWHLGIQMGNAVASVLFGEHNPEGKLAASFPTVTGQCPIYYDHPSTGRPGGKSKFTSKYLDTSHEAVFPFGYGLSYTVFAYSDMQVNETKHSLNISVTVTNTGHVEGIETVQLYMRDVTASIVRPVKELKGFEKVKLQPKESKTVTIELIKENMGYYNNKAEYVMEDGIFILYVGGNSRDCLAEEIIICFGGRRNGSI